MKEVLVTVFSDNKDSKVLEVLKNYKELLKDLNVCTQHYIYKKGLFIDIPKDSFKNIVFVEVSKDTDHNAKSNFTSPASVCAGVTINITNTSTPAPASCNWDFGDGTFSTAINPVKSYS